VAFELQPQANKEHAMSVPNINHVVLTGRLTRTPELRVLPSGASVCNLRVAVNTRRRDAAGEWGDRPNFFDVVVYGAHGETIAKYMHKGRPVALDGRLEWREWETNDDRKAQAVRIIARTVQMLGTPLNDDSGGVANEATGRLHSIIGDEEFLDIEDQDAVAAAAAAG